MKVPNDGAARESSGRVRPRSGPSPGGALQERSQAWLLAPREIRGFSSPVLYFDRNGHP